MKCNKCTRTISDDNKFCPYCGTAIEIHKELNIVEPITEEVTGEQYEKITTASGDEMQQDASLSENALLSQENDIIDRKILCGYCGAKIAVKGGRCPNCGKKSWIKTIVCIISAALVLAASIAIAFMHAPQKTAPQDISTITGSPEFYGVQWEMGADEAASLIEIKNKSIKGYKSSLGSKDSFIYTEEPFNLYGLSASKVYCGFDVLKLDSVIIEFPNDKVTLEKVVKLYTKIYGNPTELNRWVGPKTTIDIWDNEIFDEEDKSILVRYKITENSEYTMLSLDGTETDPFGFTDGNRIFGKKASDFISGLTADEDYVITKNDYYTSYKLYPSFVYMGIPKGSTAIELFVDAGDSTISLVNYLFLFDADETEEFVSQIKNMKDKFDAIYGSSVSSSYASIILDGSGQKDISFDEMIEMFKKGTQGMYNIQWKKDGSNITLGITIDPGKKYFEGSVGFTD